MKPEQGLPANLGAERIILGSILLDHVQYDVVAGTLDPADFSNENHRRIFTRMRDLHDRGGQIDRITVHNELQRYSEAESCGGLGYLVSLDDGLPQIPNLDGYIRIVKEKSTLRQAIFAAHHLINRCLEARDGAADILADAEVLLAKLAERQQVHGGWLNPGEVIMAYPGGIEAFMHPPTGGAGIPLPWPYLSKALCGLQRGDLFLIAGRPSMGKSVVAMQVGYHAPVKGEGVALISLEMDKAAIIRRLICAVGSVDAQRFRAGCLDREERKRVAEAASQIENLPLWIDDTKARTMPALVSAVRKLIARHSVRVLVIDHLQLMKGIGRFESRHHELSEISHGLKHLAGQLGITVVLLSQLNRECEKDKRPPRLADLKETGTLEEDADVVLFVHRPEQYNRQERSLRGQAEFIVGKQRNGPTGKCKMLFQHEYQRFAEVATSDEVAE
jgi:replicative DNA helicase